MAYLLEAWDKESGDSNREVVGDVEDVSYRIERLPESVSMSVERVSVSENVLGEPEGEGEPETETQE